MLPIKRIGGTLTLAMADPTNVFALDDVAFMTSLQILPVVAPQAAIRQAMHKRSSFNLINTSTGFKVDIFIRADDPFERMALARRKELEVEGSGGQKIFLLAPEDVILSKLRWYRIGGEVSEQQWKDLIGVVKTQRPRLDEGYLRQWAEYLRVADLFERALAEVAGSEAQTP